MAQNNDPERRGGPSPVQLLISLIGIATGLVASGITAYNSLQNDVSSLKRGEVYQERVNDALREEIRSLRAEIKEMRNEQREDIKDFGKKVDTLIDQWPRRKF
jgi:cell division protein FtsB